MMASGSAILSALLVMQGPAELEAGARVDTRVGEVPASAQGAAGQTTPTQQKQLLISATPLFGLRWRDEDSELRALSATRILWRPVPLAGARPLFLETLESSLVERPSRRSRFQLTLRGSYGEEDYTSLAQQFLNQPALPAARTLLTLSATGEGSWQQSRRTTLTLLVGVLHRRTPDSQTLTVTNPAGPSWTGPVASTITVPALPTQTLITATPGLRHALDRRTSLEALVALSETDIRGIQVGTSADARVNVLAVQPQLGVVDDLSRSHRLRAFAGLTYAAVLANPDKSRPWLPFTPLLRAELGSLLWRTRASAIRSTLVGGTTWYADPVLGAAVLRGTAEARLDGAFGQRWNVGVRGTFTTDLNQPLAPAVTGGVAPDETVVQVETPVRYRWSSQLDVEFGARYGERAPSLRAPGFTWRSREAWAFLTLLTTTRQTSTRPQARTPS
jgi:hypothetical protein